MGNDESTVGTNGNMSSRRVFSPPPAALDLYQTNDKFANCGKPISARKKTDSKRLGMSKKYYKLRDTVKII